MTLARTRLIHCLSALALLGLASASAHAGPSLLVSNSGTDQILQYDASTGNFIKVFASDPSMAYPWGLTYGPDNNLYVADLGTGAILRFNGATGAAMPAAGQTGAIFVPAGIMAYPNNIAFTGGNMFVDDFALNRISEFNATTGALVNANFATVQANVNGTNANPTGMLFDSNANDTVDGNHFLVAVSNPFQNSSNPNQNNFDDVAQISANGLTQTKFTHNGTPGKQLIAPAGLALQPATTSGGQGTLWAASFNNTAGNPSLVQGYAYNLNNGNDGKVNITISSSLLNQPGGLVYDGNGHLFVANIGNNNILEFNTADGTPVGSGIFASGFNVPSYMVLTTLAAQGPVGRAPQLPEPGSIVLLGLGGLGLAALAVRRRLAAV